jgi:hypothetical protein
MNSNRKNWIPVKIWPFVVTGLVLLAGFMIWDYAKHRQVEKYVAVTPDIPGAEVPKGSAAELAAFHQMKDSLTRKAVIGDVRINVIWDTPEFFRALAKAEGAQDIQRHETLYHAYTERFNIPSDLVFTVIMDSASVDLRTYDVKEKSLLRNDKEISITPWQWSEARGFSSRHLEGVLSFPQRTKIGQMMIGHVVGEHLPGEKPPIWLELVLSGLPNGQEAVFRWDLPQNP